MRDFLYDIANANDIVIANGDFRLAEESGLQNGALMVMRSCVNIYEAEYGIGFEEIYPNMNYSDLGAILSEATNMLYDDGATNAELSWTRIDGNKINLNIRIKYPRESGMEIDLGL